MGKILIPGSGGGTDLDVITAGAGDVLAPKVIVDRDGEPVAGTLALSGNAQAGHVLAGEGFYTTDPKSKTIGTMTVNSLLSFSAQPYSGRQVLLKWQNPYAAAGKPFSGVIVKYATGGYPPWDGGATIYVGIGDNGTPGGWSQAIVTMPALNTTYFFTALAYVTTSMGNLYSPVYNPAAVWQSSAATQADLWLTFTGSQTYTVPQGYGGMDLFAVGGGGGSAQGENTDSNQTRGAGGGGGGYTSTVRNMPILPGQALAVTVGAGGRGGYGDFRHDGGASYVAREGVTIINAEGGHSTPSLSAWGSGGGSGGGSGAYANTYTDITPSSGGGSDGSDGMGDPYESCPGKGQHTSTRAWGEGGSTLYSGGGGGGTTYAQAPQPGGAGGGGSGGQGYTILAADGAPGTGGGSGGNGWTGYETHGGSGVVLLHLY